MAVTHDLWTLDSSVEVDRDLRGYAVEALDGRSGKVQEFAEHPGASYVVVNTGTILGRRVTIPAAFIERVDHAGERVFIDRTREQIKDMPDLNPGLI